MNTNYQLIEEAGELMDDVARRIGDTGIGNELSWAEAMVIICLKRISLDTNSIAFPE